MPNSSHMRSRPRAGIEPIHIRELLSAAGMTGFLSVLNPPVPAPHLRELGRAPILAEPPGGCGELWYALSSRADALLVWVGRQDELLRAITEVACRINSGAVRLQRKAEALGRNRQSHFSFLERRRLDEECERRSSRSGTP